MDKCPSCGHLHHRPNSGRTECRAVGRLGVLRIFQIPQSYPAPCPDCGYDVSRKDGGQEFLRRQRAASAAAGQQDPENPHAWLLDTCPECGKQHYRPGNGKWEGYAAGYPGKLYVRPIRQSYPDPCPECGYDANNKRPHSAAV